MQAMAFYIIRSFQLSESLSKNRLEYWKGILEKNIGRDIERNIRNTLEGNIRNTCIENVRQ